MAIDNKMLNFQDLFFNWDSKSPSFLRACHALREKDLGWVNISKR